MEKYKQVNTYGIPFGKVAEVGGMIGNIGRNRPMRNKVNVL